VDDLEAAAHASQLGLRKIPEVSRGGLQSLRNCRKIRFSPFWLKNRTPEIIVPRGVGAKTEPKNGEARRIESLAIRESSRQRRQARGEFRWISIGGAFR
jgi:hypothetical protein